MDLGITELSDIRRRYQHNRQRARDCIYKEQRGENLDKNTIVNYLLVQEHPPKNHVSAYYNNYTD